MPEPVEKLCFKIMMPIAATKVSKVLLLMFVLFWMEGASALNFDENNNRVQVESTLSLSDGTVYNDGEQQPVNEIVGAKVKVKKGRASSLVLDAYAQRITETSEGGEETYNETTVNQLFLSQRLGNAFKFVLGRQRVLWGHGLSFIPTDFVNPSLDPSRLDLANAKGVDSVSLDYFRPGNSMTTLVNLSDDNQRTGYGVKWTNNQLNGLDFNLVLYNAYETGNAFGVSFSTDPMRWFWDDSKGELNLSFGVGVKQNSVYQPIVTSDTDVNGTVTSCTQFGDGDRSDNPYYRSAMLGLAYEMLESRMNFRLETYYLEEGYSKEQLQQLYSSLNSGCALVTDVAADVAELVPGTIQKRYTTISFGQDSLTMSSGNRFTDNLSYSIGYTYGHGDTSGLTSLALRSHYFDSAEISLDLLVPNGESITEFGALSMDRQITLGLKLSF